VKGGAEEKEEEEKERGRGNEGKIRKSDFHSYWIQKSRKSLQFEQTAIYMFTCISHSFSAKFATHQCIAFGSLYHTHDAD